ncbi:MAG: SRPBCC family protein [Marmoricola sp.]
MPAARHQYEIYIRATPEQVWEALLDPAFTRQYFHGTAFDRPPVQGEPFQTLLPDGSPAVDGTIEVLDPPRRLVHTWHTLYDAELAAEPVSRVEWHVEPAGEGLTRLRLLHGDLAQSPKTWANVEHGWVWILDGLKTLLETGEPLPAKDREPSAVTEPDAEWHRTQAIEANNSAWELIELPDRDAHQDEDLLRRAYAAAYHWDRAAGRTPANAARADWLLAKVQLLVGRPETSLHHATRCLTTCETHGLKDFDLAYAHEAGARALKALGRDDEATREWEAAKAVPIAEDEDRAHLAEDLAVGP